MAEKPMPMEVKSLPPVTVQLPIYNEWYVAERLITAAASLDYPRDRLEIQVSYAIGMARPLSIMVETFGTEKVNNGAILDMIHTHFDFRPGAIIQNLNLRRPLYRPTAAYGHFGRHDIEAPWEDTDKVEAIRAEVGLEPALA